MFITVSLILLIPGSLCFGIYHLLSKRITEGIVVLSISFLLSVFTILMNRTTAYLWTVRIFILSFSALLYYEVYNGAGNGSAVLWFLLFPSITILVFGLKEGKYWLSVHLILLSILILGNIGYSYPLNISARFFSVYIIAAIISMTLAYSKTRYLTRLTKEKLKLEKAFDEIRIRKGLIPICSSCKKIRDDQGFWTQLESYIKNHSEAEFSHGICPDCASKLFPKLHQKQPSYCIL